MAFSPLRRPLYLPGHPPEPGSDDVRGTGLGDGALVYGADLEVPVRTKWFRQLVRW